MKKLTLILILLLAILEADVMAQDSKYPSLSEYMMTPEAEVALAKSAAPGEISAHATIKVLTPSGYKVTVEGDNGFVCTVLRGWAGSTATTASDRDLAYDAKLRAPHCFDPVASRTQTIVVESG